MSIINVDAARAPAFGLADELTPMQSEWHQHQRHQILYAVSGLLHLEVAHGSWWLPPQRAAFLTAGTRHRVLAERAVSLRTVYVAPQLVATPDWDCRVFTVSALAREMFLYAMRWSHESDPHDPLLRTYFVTLVTLALEWTTINPLPFRLPVAQSPALRRATRLIRSKLATPIGVPDLAQAAALSERTLRRRFVTELGLGPRDYLHRARMLAALAQLADPASAITQVALDVGFTTPSAFSHAFTKFVGESPRQYQQRLRSVGLSPHRPGQNGDAEEPSFGRK